MKLSNYKLEVNPISDNNGELESLTTTNIRISNLPLNIDEKELVKKFGWFGSLASVKVMWPWSEEERIRGFNVAFVAFMVRNDAEKAMTSLQGTLLGDQRLKISWGKPVQIPLKPFWSSFEHYDEINRTEVSLDSNIRVNHYVNKCTREVQCHKRGVAIPPPLSLKTNSDQITNHQTYNDTTNKETNFLGPEIKIPNEFYLRSLIDNFATFVVESGPNFEMLISEREINNKDYEFIRNRNSPEYLYYQWRIHMLSSKDRLEKDQTEQFSMENLGKNYKPMTTTYKSSLNTYNKKISIDNILSTSKKAKLKKIIQGHSRLKRDNLNAMVFIHDNTNATAEIYQSIRNMVKLKGTTINTKVALLFLTSDLIYNFYQNTQSMPTFIRRLFSIIQIIFEHLNEHMRLQVSILQQETINRHILRLLFSWREHFMFHRKYLCLVHFKLKHGFVLNKKKKRKRLYSLISNGIRNWQVAKILGLRYLIQWNSTSRCMSSFKQFG
jgi:U2-associated protein SR140